MNLAIMLPLRNQAGLAAYWIASTTRQSRLSSVPQRGQFTEQFGPTVEDYQVVVDFAKANGFTVTNTPPNALLVDINGTVAQDPECFPCRDDRLQTSNGKPHIFIRQIVNPRWI